MPSGLNVRAPISFFSFGRTLINAIESLAAACDNLRVVHQPRNQGKGAALRDGFKYYAAVTSYDLGSVEIESLESGIAQNLAIAVPAPAPGERVEGDKVTVFPNPYRVEARWDQGLTVRDHYLWFANLP